MFITQQELESPRNASEVRQWVNAKLEEIGSTDEGKRAVRFREGLLKELTEEALPLSIFCEYYFSSSENVTVTHKLGNQNYDVIIEDNRRDKTTLEYLEITQAHEGEDAHLRMIKLEEDGHVNTLGTITKSGTKHTGIIVDVSNEALKHDVVFDREVARILEAADRKSGKAYRKHTGLVIICDDYIAFKDKFDKDNLVKQFKKEALPKLDVFEKTFIIGWSANMYLEFESCN